MPYMPKTVAATNSVERQMRLFRELALLFSGIDLNKEYDFGIRIKFSTLASAFNELSLKRVLIDSEDGRLIAASLDEVVSCCRRGHY